MVLSCRNLHKAFGGRPAVTGLSLDVAAGEAYGLLGPNGAGKTTTSRMACGLLAPDRGRVAIAGDPARAGLGYVPQGLALLPRFTLRENLRFWARLQGIPRRERPDRIAEALAAVGCSTPTAEPWRRRRRRRQRPVMPTPAASASPC